MSNTVRYGITKSKSGHSYVWVDNGRGSNGRLYWTSGKLELNQCRWILADVKAGTISEATGSLCRNLDTLKAILAKGAV